MKKIEIVSFTTKSMWIMWICLIFFLVKSHCSDLSVLNNNQTGVTTFTTTSNELSDPEKLGNLELKLERAYNERVKRQSGSSHVIGAAITSETNAGDWMDLKVAANEGGSRRGRTRGKRNVNAAPMSGIMTLSNLNEGWSNNNNNNNNNNYHDHEDILYKYLMKVQNQALQLRPGKRGLVTQTQRYFAEVNRDFNLAQEFQLFERLQRNPTLQRNIKLNPNGVTCQDVCVPDSVGYGLLGLCTGNFCKCNIKTHFSWNLGTRLGWGRVERAEQQCPGDKVFDPITLNCECPMDTILCSDDLLYGSDVSPIPETTTSAPIAITIPHTQYGPPEHQAGYPLSENEYNSTPKQGWNTVNWEHMHNWKKK